MRIKKKHISYLYHIHKIRQGCIWTEYVSTIQESESDRAFAWIELFLNKTFVTLHIKVSVTYINLNMNE